MKTLKVEFDNYDNWAESTVTLNVDGEKFLEQFETKNFNQTGEYKVGSSYSSGWCQTGDEMTLYISYPTERMANNAQKKLIKLAEEAA